MRNFDDSHGNTWQAVLLDASYGNITLLFTAVQGDDIRHQLMSADNMAEAVEQLADMDDEDLRTILAQAQPWGPGVGGS
ncbi:hypothetical protein KVP09_10825 [Alcaligenaceae bacterium CGII-47]|nr:hypothetical protein [Alcaligenaceae bacterium CGII-47]